MHVCLCMFICFFNIRSYNFGLIDENKCVPVHSAMVFLKLLLLLASLSGTLAEMGEPN